jgi:hypothetical protein
MTERTFSIVYIKRSDFLQILLFKVKRATSDLGVGTINMVYDRNKIVDFSKYVYAKEFSLLTRKPIPIDSFYKVVYPFNTNVWIGVAISVFIMIFAFYFLYHLSGSELHSGPDVFDFILITTAALLVPVECNWFDKGKRSTGIFL